MSGFALQGLWTVAVTDHEYNHSHFLAAPHNELHSFYLDDKHDARRSSDTSASRDALTAFIAFKQLVASRHDFKWMFVAPATTLFFAEAAQRAVKGLDWKRPHIITGSTCALCSLCAPNE